jgi:hypothetical protein
MANVDGYKVEMSDGMTAMVIPHGNETELTVGTTSISISKVRGKIRLSFSVALDVKGITLPVTSVSKARIAKPTELMKSTLDKNGREIATRCGRCRGVRFCITNGCLNIGCGWICSIEP